MFNTVFVSCWKFFYGNSSLYGLKTVCLRCVLQFSYMEDFTGRQAYVFIYYWNAINSSPVYFLSIMLVGQIRVAFCYFCRFRKGMGELHVPLILMRVWWWALQPLLCSFYNFALFMIVLNTMYYSFIWLCWSTISPKGVVCTRCIK